MRPYDNIENSSIKVEFSTTINQLNKYIKSINYNNYIAKTDISVINLISNNHESLNIFYPNNSSLKNYNWPSNQNTFSSISHNFSINPYANYVSDNKEYGFITQDISLQGGVKLTLYNNLFSNEETSETFTTPIDKLIELSENYFWDESRIQNTGDFNQNNMIVFNNNPLENIDHSSSGGTNYYPLNTNSYIIYNQALYQNGLFYSGNTSNIYTKYYDYSGNDSNTDYSIFDPLGDDINYTINVPSWFIDDTISFSINNRYKWVCFDVPFTPGEITTDKIKLNLSNVNKNTLGTNILFYIKIKYNGNLVIDESIIYYSKWFDCLSVADTNISKGHRVITNKSGIYNNNIARGTYPLELIIPYFSSYASNLILLIGLNNIKLNINNLSININQP